MMTKKRIHVIYAALCLSYTVYEGMIFMFFHRDVSRQDRCRIHTVLTKTGYFAAPFFFFATTSLAMFFNYVVIIYKLRKSSKSMEESGNIKIRKLPRNNVKLTRAIIMTLTAYNLFFIPAVAVTSVGSVLETFIGNSLFEILEDISLLCYFSNNLINPLIYYFTLKDFKDGYSRLLCCCARHPIQEKPTIKVAVI